MDSQLYYMRNTDVVAVTGRDLVLLVRADGAAVTMETANTTRWSSLLELLVNPVADETLREGAGSLPECDDALWRKLVAGGYLLASPDREELLVERDKVFAENVGFHLVRGAPVCDHLLFACTGSIVAGLMAQTVLSLAYSNFQSKLDVIITEAAQNFASRSLFEFYGIRSWCDAFERQDGISVPHVELGRSADCILVMPATANALHRLAHGACTDLLSMTVAATKAPVILVPVMNEMMWNNPAVRRNTEILRADGVFVIEPTIIFGAADLARGGNPMYGGHGTLWSGPKALMSTISRILEAHGSSNYG